MPLKQSGDFLTPVTNLMLSYVQLKQIMVSFGRNYHVFKLLN